MNINVKKCTFCDGLVEHKFCIKCPVLGCSFKSYANKQCHLQETLFHHLLNSHGLEKSQPGHCKIATDTAICFEFIQNEVQFFEHVTMRHQNTQQYYFCTSCQTCHLFTDGENPCLTVIEKLRKDLEVHILSTIMRNEVLKYQIKIER